MWSSAGSDYLVLLPNSAFKDYVTPAKWFGFYTIKDDDWVFKITYLGFA